MPTREELHEIEEPEKPAPSLLVRWYQYRRVLQTRWWVLVLSVGVAMLLAGWYNVSQPVRFCSVGRMMVSGQISLPGAALYSEEAQNFFGTQVSLMESQMVRTGAEARVRTVRPELAPCAVTLSVSQQPRASIFVLQAIGDQPDYSEALLNAVMQEYMSVKRDMRSRKSDTTVSAIADELEILEKKIKTVSDELIQFQKENNVAFLQSEGNVAASYLSGVDRRLADLNTEYQLLTLLGVDENIDRMGARKPAESGSAQASSEAAMAGYGFGPPADYAHAKDRIKFLKAKLASFSENLRPIHPIVQQLNDEISMQERLIQVYKQQSEAQLRARRESVKVEIQNLENERKQWSVKALDLSGRNAQYESIKSNLDRLKSLYNGLLSSMQAVDVNKNLDQNIVAILEQASPSAPLKIGASRAFIMALLGGLGFGLTILFLFDLLDGRIVSTEEFAAHFGGRVLGRIPSEKCQRLTLLYPEDPAFSEAFGGVRSAFVFHPYEGKAPHVILVTSAVPNEGKSTVASNLAATMAQGGTRTLLIDGDLRRGNIHNLFEVSNEAGFSEIVSGQREWRSCTQSCPLKNLTLITRGAANETPSAHLLAKTTDDFLKSVGDAFDCVILDSAPVLAVDDTTVLAPRVDGVIFVVRLGFSTSKNIHAAFDLLKDRRVSLVGTVLNALNPAIDGYTYYYYSSYYSSREWNSATKT